MVENRSMVEHAHEIQALAKELEHFLCLLPDKFVAGGIIAKLSSSWRDFATSLKHKRQEFNVAELIGSLDVEERARAKDNRGKGVESSAANMVQKKNSFAPRNKKKKNMQENNNAKPKQTAQFKKKNNKNGGGCFVCGSDEHWASACLDRKYKQEKKSANMVISETEGGTSVYDDDLQKDRIHTEQVLPPEQLTYMYPLGGERGSVGKVLGLHPTYRYLDRMFWKTIDCKGGEKGNIADYSRNLLHRMAPDA
ncbi:uncharacterized protein [Miscanthus floridulus]|uniref:uncharacterized protein n=1 Tax=Miscanthus floridulus TaxID=154761 RepID=UPI0034598D8F